MNFMATTIDLRAYKATVIEKLRLSKGGEPQVFENSGPDHARIVLDVMVGDCSKTLDIVSGDLSRDVWGVQWIKDFLARGGEPARIRVLLDEISGNEVPKSSALFGLNDTRIEVRRLSRPFAAHLCIGDRKHIRLEYKKSTCEASITFGDENAAGTDASAMFNNLWDAGDEIGIPNEAATAI